MTSHSEQTGPEPGQLSPAFLGAILGTVTAVHGDPVAALAGHRLQALAAAALAEVLRRPAEISPLPSGPASPDFAFACSFAPITMRDEFVLRFDEAAARAIAGPLLADHVAVRGVGPLLEAERGVLDYAVEAWADALGRRLGDTNVAPIIRPTHHEPDRPSPRNAGTRPVYRQLVIPPKRGVLALSVPPGLETRRLARFADLSDGTAANDPWAASVCTVRVALPPIRLDDVNLAALEAGDVLLVGQTSLEHLSAEATLCSDSGWTIGRVQIRHDSAATLSVEVLTIDPEPQSTDAQSMLLYVLVGSVEITGAQLGRLRPGTVLDLHKPVSNPLRLRAGGRNLARGAFVTARGEIGVRITEIPARNPTQ